MLSIPDNSLKLPKENEIELTFFGNGYGESIVIYIPKIGWGIIDSFTTKIKNKIINQAN